jgi:hypothetical protein
MIASRERLILLAERRARLRAKAVSERESLAVLIERSDEAGLLLQRARHLIDELRRRPWIVAGGAALLVSLRPRRALGWLMKGWSAWRLYRGAQRWWSRVAREANLPARSGT